jgi:glycerol-3-phosphate O-acyltransferase
MVNENKRPNLEYYKNNCISFFIPAAYTSLAILERDAFQFTSAELQASYGFQQEFFKDEFAYDVDRSIDSLIRKNIKSFIDDAILIPHPTLPDTYNLTSAGFRKLRLYAIFLKTYYESYWIVLNHLQRTPQNAIGTRERIKKIEALGNRMYRKEEIERKEALSKVNYKNALKFFTSRGLTGSGGREKLDFYTKALHRYLSVLGS